MRPGFAITTDARFTWGELLRGRSARVIVTMGMPALVYRWFFFAHSLRSLERNIRRFVGVGPVRDTIIGMIEACGAGERVRWMAKMQVLGRTAR